MRRATTLAHMGLFQHLDLAELRELLARSEERTLADGEDAFVRGDAADDALLVLEGCLEAHIDAAGQRRVLGRVEVGGIVGERALFIEGHRRSATITAIGPTTCLRLTPALLEEASDHPAVIALELHLLHSLAQRARTGTRYIQSAWRTEAPAPTPPEPPRGSTPTRGTRRRRLLRMLRGR